jgi:penicillin amidase
MLREWDFQNTIDAEAATYYEAWWDALFPMIWDEVDSAKVKLAYPTTFNTIKLIRENPELSFFDLISTPEKETARDVLQKSFIEGVRQVENWKENKGMTLARWADYKDTFVGHLLRMEGLSYHVEHGGNHDIVNASSHSAGPSWRMVVSLEKNGVKAWGVYPGGQSGNPGSPHYSSMLDRWSRGQYFELNFSASRDGFKNAALATTTLNPVKP